MSSSSSSPSLHILAREPNGFSLISGPPFVGSELRAKIHGPACSSASFSSDGTSLLAITNGNSAVRLYDCSSASEKHCFEISAVSSASLSPRSTYLLTFRKPSADSQGKNVTLWRIADSTPVFELFQKNISKATWPLIRFSDDESVACRMATNEIHFFDPNDFSKGVLYKLRIPGIAGVELPRLSPLHLAAFVPESKGIPASVQIFSCNKDAQSQVVVARRSFFRCSSVQMLWNRSGTGLLVVAQSDVDKSNQSYYGESKLSYLTTDGSHEGQVPLRKEGPIHDVQWSPSGTEFAVVYGFMPAKVTLFDKKCNPIFELGTGPYNTLRWNPRGKFLCVAGFGNLPGDMAFWDCVEKKLLGTTKAEWSVTCEWSPDGQYLMNATTAPRLQVDNGIKIFQRDGSLYYKRMYDKLYQAEWQPEALDKFDDLEELQSLVKGSLKIDTSSKSSQPSQVSQPPTKASNLPQKPAAYRPPHAKAAAVAQAELFGETGRSEEMSKNALRNKKKREKQREKKAAEAASSVNGS